MLNVSKHKKHSRTRQEAPPTNRQLLRQKLHQRRHPRNLPGQNCRKLRRRHPSQLTHSQYQPKPDIRLLGHQRQLLQAQRLHPPRRFLLMISIDRGATLRRAKPESSLCLVLDVTRQCLMASAACLRTSQTSVRPPFYRDLVPAIREPQPSRRQLFRPAAPVSIKAVEEPRLQSRAAVGNSPGACLSNLQIHQAYRSPIALCRGLHPETSRLRLLKHQPTKLGLVIKQ